MKKWILVFLVLLFPLFSLLASSSTLNLTGIVSQKHLFELDGFFEAPIDAIRLDEGDVLPEGGFGIT